MPFVVRRSSAPGLSRPPRITRQEADRTTIATSVDPARRRTGAQSIGFGSRIFPIEEPQMKAVPFGTATGRRRPIVSQRLRRRALRDRLRDAVIRIHTRLSEWRRLSRSRADLARLDDRMLRDIGVTRVEVWREINKPFWRK